MDVADFKKKWEAEVKAIEGAHPVDKTLLAGANAVLGGISQLKTISDKMDSAASDLKKQSILANSTATATAKEVAAFAALAKKAGKDPAVRKQTKAALDGLVTRIENIRAALLSFDK